MIENKNFVPFECPLCLTLMIDGKDTATFLSFECCSECLNEYLIPNSYKNAKDAKITPEIKKELRKKRQALPSYILR